MTEYTKGISKWSKGNSLAAQVFESVFESREPVQFKRRPISEKVEMRAIRQLFAWLLNLAFEFFYEIGEIGGGIGKGMVP